MQDCVDTCYLRTWLRSGQQISHIETIKGIKVSVRLKVISPELDKKWD